MGLAFSKAEGNSDFGVGSFPRPSFPSSELSATQLFEESAFGLLHALCGLAITRVAAQVVQMRHRDTGEPLVLGFSVLLVFALENVAGCRSAQGLVDLIDQGQQLQVSAGVALRKAVSPIGDGLDRASVPVASDEPRDLGPAEAGHLLQVAA